MWLSITHNLTERCWRQLTMSLTRVVYLSPDLQIMGLTGGSPVVLMFNSNSLPRVSHDIVGEGVNFQFQLAIFNFNFQFQFSIPIFNSNFQFQFSISIFNFNFQFQFSISIFNFNFQFQFSISIFNFNIQIQFSISIFNFQF